jgi:hypothetical protein
MKTVEGICRELKALDGVVGAFVLNQSECLATSLPPQYDTARLIQVGSVLSRINQMSQKAGFERSATAFHWQRASLLSWPLGEEAMLAVLAAPNAVRDAVELSASMALEELTNIVLGKGGPRFPSIPSAANAAPVPSAAADASMAQRLEHIEQLLVEELGSGGKALLERSLRKVPRGTAPLAVWLLDLRRSLLADIPDAGARVTIAMCADWAESD